MSFLSRLAAGLLALTSALHGAAGSFRVTVGPAPVERAAQVVTFTLPDALANGAILRDASGQLVPLQVEADLSAKFIVARQAANQTLQFTLEPGRQPEQGNVQVVEEPSPPRPGAANGIAAATAPSMIQPKAGRLRVSVGGRPILYYQMDRDAVPREDIDPARRRAGYLHPVLTPSGFVVTEGYPSSGPLSGSIALGISGNDPPIPSRLEFGAVDNTWAGPVHGGFSSWQHWMESEGINSAELVNESWELTAYAVPKELGELNLFDVAITWSNATGNPMDFRGGAGLKVTGPKTWEDQSPIPAGSSALFAEDTAGWGKAGSPELWGGSMPGSRWIGLAGPGRNRPAGFAILATQPDITLSAWRGSFIVETSESITKVFAPGARVTVRNRFVVFDGAPDKALLAALWNGYTVTAAVTIGAADGR